MKVKDIVPKLYRKFKVILITQNGNQMYEGSACQVPHWLFERQIIEEHPYEDAQEYIIV